VLKPGGRLFHYTGAPNRLTSGRDVPREVAKRLDKAGFKAELALDGVFAIEGRRPAPLARRGSALRSERQDPEQPTADQTDTEQTQGECPQSLGLGARERGHHGADQQQHQHECDPESQHSILP
jgi:hypothetical protein